MKIKKFLKTFLFLLNEKELIRIKKIFIFYFFTILLELISITSLVPLIGFIISPELTMTKVQTYISIDTLNYLNFKVIDTQSILISLCTFVIIAFGIKNLLLALIVRYRENFFAKLHVGLSQRVFKKYLEVNYKFFLKGNSSSIVRNLDREIPNLISLIKFFIDIVVDSIIILSISIVLISLNYKLYLSIICILILFSFFYIGYFKKIIKIAGAVRQEYQMRFLRVINETFGLLNYIKVEKLNTFFYKIFSNISDTLVKANLKRNLIVLLSKNLLEFILIIFLSSAIMFLYFDSKDLDYVQFQIGITLLCVIRLMPSFTRIVNSINSIKFISVSLKSIKEIQSIPLNFKFKEKYLSSKLEKISIKNIYFKFDKNKKFTLSNVSIDIESNDKICIVGETGSGKSTLLNLILGLVSPSSGKVLVNGDNYPLYLFNNMVSYVPQDILILESSIKNNIYFDKSVKDFKPTDLMSALSDSDLYSLVQSKKQKENFPLLENGKNISFGQKQRIGIARAIIGKSNILVLDEATSSLDEKTEKTIFNNLVNRYKKKMIICVTHRLSNLKYFNKAFKVENGKLLRIK
ncbi:phospholipid-lipopolysaccharide ABC transporter [Candidatus Pelagibacter sp. IMCC9063]|uniref:ATP-binding cassette domain-containing protein n=1 Tax=Pelagibacter sp. (strain IMCC9063) TaxID=1002672 RepID=UPI00020464E3|nr:ABC transporter ATP-binding protein [Candidatus Pelagibacter sp. IMCC9063]AEA80597.1 phospholipid-lipopolysaccharide ABC transporter [Candidatus Pelagibacter sp. IMCC9063]